jgi:hypothetical protein
MNLEKLKEQILAQPMIHIDTDADGFHNESHEVHIAAGEHGHAIYFDVDAKIESYYDVSTGQGESKIRYLYTSISEVIWNGDKVTTTTQQDAELSEVLSQLIEY